MINLEWRISDFELWLRTQNCQFTVGDSKLSNLSLKSNLNTFKYSENWTLQCTSPQCKVKCEFTIRLSIHNGLECIYARFKTRTTYYTVHRVHTESSECVESSFEAMNIFQFIKDEFRNNEVKWRWARKSFKCKGSLLIENGVVK